MRLAADLARASAFGYWTAPPSYAALVSSLERLVTFRTWPEFELEVRDVLGERAVLKVSEVHLGADASQPATQDLAIHGLTTPLQRSAAVSILSQFRAMRPAHSYRIHDGKARLLARGNDDVVWSSAIGHHEDVEPPQPPVTADGRALARLRALNRKFDAGAA
jgi:hypothetical protein